MKIAVIPARGGSKRIPKKNIRIFCGKPIIAYSIELALKSNLFDHVIVSTDNDEIAEISKDYGAEIPFMRPKYLSDDFTGTNSVVKHAIQWYQQQGKLVSIACSIYATAPLLRIQYLKDGYEKLVNHNKLFTFSATGFAFPIQRAIRISKNNKVEAFWPEYINSRSQDLEKAYHDAGQFYWGRSEAFLQDKIVFSEDSLPIILPRYLVQDIDTVEDWICAEQLFKSTHIMKSN